MLEIKVVDHPQQKQELFREFDPQNGTWLVSDLKSKLEIQKRFLRSGELLAEDSVLRASELWRKFLAKGFPGHRVVSADLARGLLAQWLESSDFKWARSPGAAQNLFAYCAQLLPILVHDQGDELMQEWFGDHPDSLVRWGHWYQLAKWAWVKLDEAHLVPSPWVSSWLNYQDGKVFNWPRKVYVDLGSELSAVESEVIWQLAQNTEVLLVTPGSHWRKKFGKSLRGYRLIEEKLGISESHAGEIVKSAPKNFQFFKYSSMLAEVKAAVNQTRQWIQEGVEVQKIVLMAPDIEEYWPVLSAYLAHEGIPVSKDRVTPLQSFPDIISWLARLRMDAGKGNAADMELCSFSYQEKNPLPYEEFKRLFAQFYDLEDLQREKKVARLFEIEERPQGALRRDEFVAWAASRWPIRQATDHLESLVQIIFQDSPAGTQLKLNHWLVFLEKLCAKMEVKSQKSQAHTKGILLLNLMSGEWVDTSHIWVMGLSEEGMRKTEATGILLADVLSLERDVGFYINHPDRMQAEYEAEWMLDRPWSQAVLSNSQVGFSGEVQSPALMWLSQAVAAGVEWEKLTSPEPTRWDQVQELPQSDLIQFLDWDEAHKNRVAKALPIELGQIEFELFKPTPNFSLSVSTLETFFSCPFKVAAKKLFHLSDRPDLDLDIDHMARGSLIHKLFEILTLDHPFRTQYTQDELREKISLARAESDLSLADERLWPPLEAKLLTMAWRFIETEQQWREKFPLMHTVGRELSVKCLFDLESFTFKPMSEGQGVVFRGKLDRVDSDDQGHQLVFDYKSTGNGLTHYGSWVKNDKLQLALYSHWLELGLSELGPGEVVGALYYVAEDMVRNKGMILEGGVESFIADENRYHRIKISQKSDLYREALEKTSIAVVAMMSGDFTPRPSQGLLTCASCDWEKVCRAPHFN